LPDDEKIIRVAIQQPTLAKYRVPQYRALAQRPGIEVELLYGSRGDVPNAPPEGFKATPIQFRKWRVGRHPVYWHAAQFEAVRPGRADVAILSWDIHYASLPPALLRARQAGTPTILWGHGYSKQEGHVKRRLRNRLARMATAVMVYNEAAAARLRDEGFDGERVFVALNSLDQGPIDQARRQCLQASDVLTAFRREHQLVPGPVLLYVSRLEPKNRVDLLLDAAARLVPRFPTLRVVVIGGGDDLRRLEKMAERLGVADHVLFLGAIYDENQLAPWFVSADLFVYPANIGLSLLHAFGYGLPVVTSDDVAAQNPEIEALEQGTNGLFYKAGSGEVLAATIASALSDPAVLRQMSTAAEATVRDRFNVQTMVRGMEAAIRFCAGRRPLV
jgi:glycosyltransferase involved in cell wall biosynthesis